MGQPVGAAFILHDGKSTALGVRRHDLNRLTLATVYPIRPGFTKGKHPTFQVDVDSMAEDYDANHPPGPESKPTMPAGTVRVDVSDVYDWYKLGQHISNMKGLGKHDFGKGPPGAILSFGDEDLEHQYIQALKQTGLTTTDIDPVDPNQPAGMPRQKTDPTYNVNEADASDYELHDRPKLDRVLAKCCRMVVQGQQRDPERYGQVAACVIDPDNRMIYGINLPAKDGTRRHAERVAIDKYRKSIGEIPAGSIIVTTCSPCNSPMEERHGESCKDLLNSVGIHKVYAGYQDPTQHDDRDADFRVYVTENDRLWGECQLFAQTFLGKEELPENFADGRNPQDKGDSKRHGVPTKASVSTLRKVAKQGGRKGQLSHWLANMKAGRAKAKRNK
jgi:pyrimidine deaminase RibD-like protein